MAVLKGCILKQVHCSNLIISKVLLKSHRFKTRTECLLVVVKRRPENEDGDSRGNKQAIKQRMDNGWDCRFYSLGTPISTDFLSQPFPAQIYRQNGLCHISASLVCHREKIKVDAGVFMIRSQSFDRFLLYYPSISPILQLLGFGYHVTKFPLYVFLTGFFFLQYFI